MYSRRRFPGYSAIRNEREYMAPLRIVFLETALETTMFQLGIALVGCALFVVGWVLATASGAIWVIFLSIVVIGAASLGTVGIVALRHHSSNPEAERVRNTTSGVGFRTAERLGATGGPAEAYTEWGSSTGV